MVREPVLQCNTVVVLQVRRLLFLSVFTSLLQHPAGPVYLKQEDGHTHREPRRAPGAQGRRGSRRGTARAAAAAPAQTAGCSGYRRFPARAAPTWAPGSAAFLAEAASLEHKAPIKRLDTKQGAHKHSLGMMGSGGTCIRCSPRESSGSLISTPRCIAADEPGAGGRVWPGRRAPRSSSPSPSASTFSRTHNLRPPGARGNPPLTLQTASRRRRPAGFLRSPRPTRQRVRPPPVTAGTWLSRGSSAALLLIHGPSRGFPAFILARRQNQTTLPKPAGERQQFPGGGQRQRVPPPGRERRPHPGSALHPSSPPPQNPSASLPPQRRDRRRGLGRHCFSDARDSHSPWENSPRSGQRPSVSRGRRQHPRGCCLAGRSRPREPRARHTRDSAALRGPRAPPCAGLRVFLHCFLKTERKFTDQNYCTFEDRRQWKTSSTDCSCRKEQEYFSATITFAPGFGWCPIRGGRPRVACSSRPTLDGNACAALQSGTEKAASALCGLP
ncbi:translation initiation factor IF-2-like [Pyrgilauda ruficollis]|uniref:translation initiation factor IF-2-like n=1 Tax=Pyrgilauda ruficollis TaxID=221976 RepID=UPI001B8614CE|nr:translation initiation factor IF-2-like [Pyrgilauda ruficollis]